MTKINNIVHTVVGVVLSLSCLRRRIRDSNIALELRLTSDVLRARTARVTNLRSVSHKYCLLVLVLLTTSCIKSYMQLQGIFGG